MDNIHHRLSDYKNATYVAYDSVRRLNKSPERSMWLVEYVGHIRLVAEAVHQLIRPLHVLRYPADAPFFGCASPITTCHIHPHVSSYDSAYYARYRDELRRRVEWRVRRLAACRVLRHKEIGNKTMRYLHAPSTRPMQCSRFVPHICAALTVVIFLNEG